MTPSAPVVGPQNDTSEQACARCGALIAIDGRDRHDAWHDLVESTLTGLTADLAALTDTG